MDQAVDAGNDFGKGAEGHELDDLDVGNVAHVEAAHELVPGVHLRGLVAQGDLSLLGIEGNDVDLDLIADLHDLGRALDAAPAQLGNMDHAVHAADIDERAVRGQGLDNALILLADLDLGPDLLHGSAAKLSVDRTDGADDSAAGAVDLGDLHLDSLALEGGQLASAGNAGLGSGDKDADALDVGNNAALVFLGDDALDDLFVLADGLDLVPYLHAVELLLGELDGTFRIVHAYHKDFDLIADLENVFGFLVGVGADLVCRDIAGMLGAQIYLDLSRADRNNRAEDLVSRVQSFD